jgi:hypothetical protein
MAQTWCLRIDQQRPSDEDLALTAGCVITGLGQPKARLFA